MDKIEPFLNELTLLFQEMIEKRNNPSQSLLDNIKKQGQFLAACLKRVPEVSTNEKVIELLGLYAAPSKREYPKIYSTAVTVVDLCLKNLPSTYLAQIWDLTADIGLCQQILSSTTIPSDVVFSKIVSWIDSPSSDSTFYSHFLEILQTPNESEVSEEVVSKIIPFLVDSSAIRSSLACLTLSTFESISQTAAYLVLASWLQCKNRRIQSAHNCRKILSLAPTSVLNYAATLSLEFPTILCILPKKTMGFDTLASITLHRIIALLPDALIPFIELCDQSVRTLLYDKTLKKEEINEQEVKIYPPLRLYDASYDPEVRITDLFNTEVNNDLIASAAWFARMTVKTSIDIDINIKKQIYSILKRPKESLKEVENCDILVGEISETNEKLQQKNISDLRTMIESPVI